MRGLVGHPSWSLAFEVSAKLATLTARWGSPCRIELDEFTGKFAAWRDECPLASGTTQLDAVEAALELWPACAYCGGGVPEDSKAHAWPMCGQCPDTKLPPKWKPKEPP